MAEHIIQIVIEIEDSEIPFVVADIDSTLTERANSHFWTITPDPPDVCPFDCDSCHGEDCPCDRLGCEGSGVHLD